MLLVMGLVNNGIFTIICLCVITLVVCVYLLHTTFIVKKQQKQNDKETSSID